MRERLQSSFRRSIQAARARYALGPTWFGTVQLEDFRTRRLVRRFVRQTSN